MQIAHTHWGQAGNGIIAGSDPIRSLQLLRQEAHSLVVSDTRPTLGEGFCMRQEPVRKSAKLSCSDGSQSAASRVTHEDQAIARMLSSRFLNVGDDHFAE